MGQSVNDGDGRGWERWHGVHTGVQGTTLTLGEQETRFDRKQQQHEAALGKSISHRAREEGRDRAGFMEEEAFRLILVRFDSKALRSSLCAERVSP